MSWLQLRLDCEKATAEELENRLLLAGALSVTLEDRADEPLLEPGVGETPLWQAVRITGLFAADADLDAIRDQLPEGREPRVEILEDRDWAREWIQHYRPMRFGDRLRICPSWHVAAEDASVNLLLDPGLAFGTGTHPTTAMCLRALDRRVQGPLNVVDYGCGSGILGIAALRLGAVRLLAVDNDPQALTATRANAERNGIDPAAMQLLFPEDDDIAPWRGQADLVLANILAGPLESLAVSLRDLLAESGEIILAGLLASQAQRLIDVYGQNGIRLDVIEQEEDWVCLAGRLLP
ncbi:MAG: 50S ribosomal protein L11 methyltransferase [Pseudomonadota bacterium]